MAMGLSFSGLKGGHAQRGEETRCRLLQAAFDVFAGAGYEAAHTRDLAERAGVKLPAIPYYFGSKEGLFRAVIEEIAQGVHRRLAPAAERAAAALADAGTSRETLTEMLLELLDSFVDCMLGAEFPQSWRMICSRAEVENLEALRPLRDAIVGLMIDPSRELIARLIGQPKDDMHSWMRAVAILGQINIFSKPQVRAGLGWTDYGAEQVAAVQSIVREHVVAILAAAEGEKP